MKRVCILILMTFLLTGCVNTLSITNEQNNMMAEYMAHTLLKYDKNYDNKLINLATTEPVTENVRGGASEIEPPTTEPNNSNTNKKDANKSDNKSIKTEDINTILGTESIAIACSKYSIEDNYKDKDIFNLEASKGRKLLVLNFTISNKSSKEQKFNIFNNNISFNVVINGKSYTQMLTMYTKDMATYDTTIKSGSNLTGVLFFDIDKTNEKVDDLSIYIVKNNSKSLIKVK